MLEPLTDNTLHDHLSAYADGELTDSQSAALWIYLAESDGRDAAVRHLANLHAIAEKARLASHVEPPPELRQRVLTLIETAVTLPKELAVPKLGSQQRSARLVGLATAASFVLGMAALFAILRGGNGSVAAAPVVPPTLVVEVSRVHAYCSRLPDDLHNATFAAINEPLSELVQTDLDETDAAPNLASIGFRFVGAGPCPAAKFGTVHLLYKSTRIGSRTAVSLFIQKDSGQWPRLQLGRVFRVSSPISPFPLLAWRDGKAVYFLVSDDQATGQTALQALRPKADNQIVAVATP